MPWGNMPRVFFVCCIAVFLSCWPNYLRAENVKRSILAIFDDEIEYNFIHKSLESVLNYYGFKVDYLNSEDRYPQNISQYRAVLTWAIDEDFYNAEALHQLLGKAQSTGVHLIFLGQIPGYIEKKSGSPLPELHGALLKRLGIKIGRYNLMNPLFMQAERIIPELVDFEQQFVFKGIVLPNIESFANDNSVALTVVEKQGHKLKSDLVVTAPWGGYALNPAVFEGKPKSPLRRWILNPFQFLEKALDLGSYPIPDITTWNGCRAIYCHIDGDGFEGICRFDKKRLCAEVVFEDVIEKYKYPHTLSLIHIYFDPEVTTVFQDAIVDAKIYSTSKIPISELTRERWIKVAKRLFAPSLVEAGLHGYCHPLNWEERENALRAPQGKFSLDDEIFLSKKIYSNLMPEKPPMIFLWTGDCAPTEEALKKCSEAGLLNINGGDSLFDQTFNSYMHVAPLYRQLGRYIQVHSSAANENIYTNNWQGPFYGFRNVIETFQRTGSPRRMSPVNVYYHFYSGEMMASVQALHEIFDWAAQQELIPIRTSDYVKSVHGFISAEIEPIPEGWRIKNFAGLRTLRFEGELRQPDMMASCNLWGYYRQDQQLYVHLKPSESAEIHWSEKAQQPRLEKANCVVNHWSITDQHLTVECWGYRPAVIDFRDLGFKVKSKKGIVVTLENNLTRLSFTPSGHLSLDLPCESN